MLKKSHHFAILAIFLGIFSIGIAIALKISAQTNISTDVPSCSYSYTSWSSCTPNGIQTRSVVSKSPEGCTTNPPPELQRSCVYSLPSCSFKYSDWSVCSSGGIQKRTVTSKSPEPCQITTNPILEQTCSPTSTIAPTPCLFTYSNWSACSSQGKQTRTIASKNPSGCITTSAPILEQNCNYSGATLTEEDSSRNSDENLQTSPSITPELAYLNVKDGQVMSGEFKIETRVSNALAVEFYLTPVESNILKYLGSGQKISQDTWGLAIATTKQPNGAFYLRTKIKNIYGVYEGAKRRISIINQIEQKLISSVQDPVISKAEADLLYQSDADQSLENRESGMISPEWKNRYFSEAECKNSDACNGSADPDKDGLDNNEEFRLGTNPNNPDTDQDGFLDGDEVKNRFDPIKASLGDKSDRMIFESPKEKGEIKKDTYQIHKIEMIRDEAGQKKTRLSGKALPNTFVTIYIYSDPVILTVKTDSDGNWSYELDKDIEDGEHEVYVAITDNTGKITAKSEPIAFVKTAEAISIIPPVEASTQAGTQSPTQVWSEKDLYFFIAIGLGGLALTLAAIGLVLHAKNKKEQQEITVN